jgi:predicted transcriptional regulator
MVTKEEFGQFIAEFEAFRDMTLEEIGKMHAEIEKLKDQFDDLLKEIKININKKIG